MEMTFVSPQLPPAGFCEDSINPLAIQATTTSPALSTASTGLEALEPDKEVTLLQLPPEGKFAVFTAPFCSQIAVTLPLASMPRLGAEEVAVKLDNATIVLQFPPLGRELALTIPFPSQIDVTFPF
jgi:hypothetical protein